MILAPIYELSILGIYDAGIPNKERIILRPTETINLAQFGIMLCLRNPDGNFLPLHDNFFWFGEIIVTPPAWIVVFTGPGEFKELPYKENLQKTYVIHWNRQYTIFNTPNVFPIIFKIESILIAQKMLNAAPQIPQ